MINRQAKLILIGLLTLMLSVTGFAQMHGDGHGKMGGKHLPILSKAEELGLSEKQVKNLKNIHHKFLTKSIEADSKLKILELDFKKSMMDGASEKELNKQVDNIASKNASKRKLHIGMHFEVKNTLSDEQWQNWKKSKHGGMMDKMMKMKKGKEHSMRKKM